MIGLDVCRIRQADPRHFAASSSFGRHSWRSVRELDFGMVRFPCLDVNTHFVGGEWEDLGKMTTNFQASLLRNSAFVCGFLFCGCRVLFFLLRVFSCLAFSALCGYHFCVYRGRRHFDYG